MKPEGWKSFSTPNPAFAPPASPLGVAAWQEKLAPPVLRFAWMVFGAGVLLTLVAPPLVGFKPWGNHGLRGIVLGWFLLFGALWWYRRVITQRALRTRDIIPAYTEYSFPSCLFIIFVSVPVWIIGCASGLIVAVLMFIERAGKDSIAVEYMHNGRIRRRMMLVPKSSPKQLMDEEIVWITRPRLFVPPRPVNRHGAPGVLDHATYDAKDWLWDAFEHAANRRNRRREIKRRAKRVARARRERGRSEIYRKPA